MLEAKRLVSDLRRHGGASLWPLRGRRGKALEPKAIIDEPDPSLVQQAAKLAAGNEDLSPRQRLELEAIAWTFKRPSFFLDAETFSQPLGHWKALAGHRSEIERVSRSVGRIEIEDSGGPRPVGTGFVVGDRRVLTNRHVADDLARRSGGGGWEIMHSLKPVIDFAEERGGVAPREYAIDAIEWLCEEPSTDAALLRIAVTDASGEPCPPPLPIATSYAPRKGRRLYLIGYPSRQPNSPSPEVMDFVFAYTYDVKRLQPGRILRSHRHRLDHDASTLGGNSGSCVVDLVSGRVIGLHFDGIPHEANYAVPLWKRGRIDEIRESFTG